MDTIPNLPNLIPELIDLPTAGKLDPAGDFDHPPLPVRRAAPQ